MNDIDRTRLATEIGEMLGDDGHIIPLADIEERLKTIEAIFKHNQHWCIQCTEWRESHSCKDRLPKLGNKNRDSSIALPANEVDAVNFVNTWREWLNGENVNEQ